MKNVIIEMIENNGEVFEDWQVIFNTPKQQSSNLIADTLKQLKNRRLYGSM